MTLPASFEFRTGGGAACIPEATPAFVKRGSQGPCAGLLTGGAGTALGGRRGAGDAVTAGALPSCSTITCWGWEPPDSLIGSEVWEATPAVGGGGCEGPVGVPAGALVAGEGGGGAVLPGGALGMVGVRGESSSSSLRQTGSCTVPRLPAGCGKEACPAAGRGGGAGLVPLLPAGITPPVPAGMGGCATLTVPTGIHFTIPVDLGSDPTPAPPVSGGT